jgi:hypothetical protein
LKIQARDGHRWTQMRLASRLCESVYICGSSLRSRYAFAPLREAILGVVVGLLVCCGVRADVVAGKGRPPVVDTQVVRIVDGNLVCRAEKSGEIGIAVEQIEYLQITGWDMFNLAEQQRRAGEWHRAAVSYEKALADLQLSAAGGKVSADALDRVLLVKARLIPPCDFDGRFERALEVYLDVVERMPSLAKALRPERFPETGAAWLTQAEARVDAAMARHATDELGRSLEEWKKRWPRPVASAPAVPEGVLPGSQADPRMREEIARMAGLVQTAKTIDALSRIGVLQGQAKGAIRAELYYWQGRILQAMAAGEPARSRAGDLPGGGPPGSPPATQPSRAATRQDGSAGSSARAGLAYMRVVVHFPGHPLVPECLYRAGDLCRSAGRAEQAKTLWNELVTAYPKAKGPDGIVWADKVREEHK